MYFGEAIALITVLCWTLSVQFFEAGSKRIGSVSVNTIRITSALICFSLLLLFREGRLLPSGFPLTSWFYLGLSGVVGFFIGDIFLFKALVELGPRVTMLLQSLTAPTAALFGWMILQEEYLIYQRLGMFVTLSGVSLVVLEKTSGNQLSSKQNVRRVSFNGVCWALLAMLGQASGLLLSKLGMQTDGGYLDPFSATQIRALGAFACFIIYLSVAQKWSVVRAGLRDKSALYLTLVGSAIGPFLGVSLSLWTLHYLEAGVASTFFSLVPICIIPFSILFHKEYVSFRAVVGAIIAILGVVLLAGW